MIPGHIIEELNKLSPAQKQKFQDLVMWAGNSGFAGSSLPVDYGKILEMVQASGETPVTPAEPDKTVNHDWNFAPKPDFPKGE